jgi:hypothetical protein
LAAVLSSIAHEGAKVLALPLEAALILRGEDAPNGKAKIKGRTESKI